MTDEEIVEAIFALLDAPDDSECLAAFRRLHAHLQKRKQPIADLVAALHDVVPCEIEPAVSRH